MTNEQFEQHFQGCVAQVGAEYIKHRDAIIKMGQDIMPELQKKAQTSDWQTKITAEILLGWLTQKSIYEQVMQDAKAAWLAGSPMKPITGTLSSTKRANILAGYGKVIVPRLIEIVTKTKEFTTGEEYHAILLALDYLKDERAVMPLVNLVSSSTQNGEKILALAVLGTLGDPRAFEITHDIFANKINSSSLRSTAVVTLGLLEDKRATSTILASAKDQSEDTIVRESAIRAIGYLGDQSASSALASLLQEKPEEKIALALVDTLSKLGDNTAIAALEKAGRTHPDSIVRRVAQEAKEKRMA